MKYSPYLRHVLVWELVGWPLLFVAGLICVQSDLWLLLVVLPLVWQLWDILALRRLSITRASIEVSQGRILAIKRICGFLAWAANMAYWGLWALVLGVRMDAWYGWLLGAVIGVILGPILQTFSSSRLRASRRELIARENITRDYRHMGTVTQEDHPADSAILPEA